MDDLKYIEQEIQNAHRTWILCVVDDDDSHNMHATHVIVGGILMFAACIFIVAWYRSSTLRQLKINDLEGRVEAEKAVLLVKGAEESARAKRELDDTLLMKSEIL